MLHSEEGYTSNRARAVAPAITGTGILMALALGAAMCQPATAATVCVNPGDTSGCFSKISDAVSAAAPGDTIQVASGKYKEDVVIGKRLSLIGAGQNHTIIDATGLPNGIYINGIQNSGLTSVVVAGFTVENANFEGILVANASSITISDSHVTDNDKNLDPAKSTCKNLPIFETGEGFDCGEGIHLSGVDHSTVANNLVDANAGGILLSDDTGATHDNLIIGNVVRNNPFDCGITLASHPPAGFLNVQSPLGVYHNTIVQNDSYNNGRDLEGAGAGVGIFDSAPGTKNFGNVVMNNRLTNNGLPGVAMHGHTPNQNLNDNVIVGNYIAGNGADTEDAATSGPTGINIFGVSPITGTIIAENMIDHEQVDVAIKTPSAVALHFNTLSDGVIGVDNLGTGTVDATQNYWGCSGGPGAKGCSNVSGAAVVFTPWLTRPVVGKRQPD